eukprot:Awhi_evm2s11250
MVCLQLNKGLPRLCTQQFVDEEEKQDIEYVANIYQTQIKNNTQGFYGTIPEERVTKELTDALSTTSNPNGNSSLRNLDVPSNCPLKQIIQPQPDGHGWCKCCNKPIHLWRSFDMTQLYVAKEDRVVNNTMILKGQLLLEAHSDYKQNENSQMISLCAVRTNQRTCRGFGVFEFIPANLLLLITREQLDLESNANYQWNQSHKISDSDVAIAFCKEKNLDWIIRGTNSFCKNGD